MFCAAFLSKKLICQILTSKLAPSLVYHGLIRALLSHALNIMSVQLTLAAGKDQLTPGKSGKFLFFFSLYVYLLNIIIIFGVENVIFLFVCLFGFVWLFLFLFCFIYLFIFLLLVVLFFLFCFFCSLFVVVFMCCFVFVFEFLV